MHLERPSTRSLNEKRASRMRTDRRKGPPATEASASVVEGVEAVTTVPTIPTSSYGSIRVGRMIGRSSARRAAGSSSTS